MTAENSSDFPYEPVRPTGEAAVRQAYWDVAMGLQQVDGLEVSAYLRKLAGEHVGGARSLNETGCLIRAYYEERRSDGANAGADAGAGAGAGADAGAGAGAGSAEADLVSQRIVELLDRNAFSFMPAMLPLIHEALFQDLDARTYCPGTFKAVALQKRELVLNGDSVVYADPALVEQSLRFAFDEEGKYVYSPLFDDAQMGHLCQFVARLWQVHPFCEGNTRTVAVFAVLYLRHLGFDADNRPFAQHACYFRDALVRASYRNAKAGIMPDITFLRRFFENLLVGSNHELRSRDLMAKALYDDPSLLRNVDLSCAIVVP